MTRLRFQKGELEISLSLGSHSTLCNQIVLQLQPLWLASTSLLSQVCPVQFRLGGPPPSSY